MKKTYRSRVVADDHLQKASPSGLSFAFAVSCCLSLVIVYRLLLFFICHCFLYVVVCCLSLFVFCRCLLFVVVCCVLSFVIVYCLLLFGRLEEEHHHKMYKIKLVHLCYPKSQSILKEIHFGKHCC